MLVLNLLNSIPVYAYDASKPFNPKDVATWTQGAWQECHDIKLAGGTGSTIARAACSYFATSYALVKAGLMDPTTGTAPLDFIKEVNRTGGWDADWGHFDVNTISNYYPEVTCEEKYFGLQQNGMSRDEALAVCKNFYNEGKFVLICVRATGLTNGHYVFLDGYDENGMMIIGDSGKPTTDLKLYLNHNVTVLYCHVYSIEGVKCNELESIYSEDVGKVTPNKNGEMSDEEKDLYGKVKEEYDLEGMGEFKNQLSSDCLVVPEYYDSSYLTVAEQNAVSDIGESVNKNKITVTSVYHTLMSFIGIVLILYSIIMFLAYFLDYNNVFIDISVLSIVTFGRFHIVTKEEVGDGGLGYSKKDKCTYVTMGMVAVRCIVVLLVGLFLVSGALSNLILQLVYFITDVLKKVR